VKSLGEVDIPVLGSLVEKDLTTPNYYPLSPNALVNACHRKSNRDPVLNLDDDAVLMFAPRGGERRSRHTNWI
jgi:hypothetical protein